VVEFLAPDHVAGGEATDPGGIGIRGEKVS
jgi:hypothetical protein